MFLTNYELIDICKFYKLPLVGVYMKDELKIQKQDGYYIINLDSSVNNGSHWVALVIKGNDNFYFDSFGCVPPTEVEQFINAHGSKVKYGFNNWICQDLKSSNCGFYCVGLFIYLKQHKKNIFKSANDFINIFYDETLLNDTVLQLFFTNLTILNDIVKIKLLLK